MRLSKIAWTLGSIVGIQQALRLAHSLDMDDLLGTVGLERRRTVGDRLLPTIGLISVSAVAGAAAALLLAPSSGAELRSRIGHRLEDAKERVSNKLHEYERASAGNGGGM